MAKKTSRQRGASHDRPGSIAFENHIFPIELDEIAKRRQEVLGQLGSGLEEARRDRRSRVIPTPPSLLKRLMKNRRIAARVPSSGLVASVMQKLRGKAMRGPLSNFRGTGPSTRLGLVGLALSGGGIRSATFDLGVLQALVKRGVFPLVDYLSTVSGGGYLGSCLSSLLADPGRIRAAERTREPLQGFPLGFEKDGTDRPALRHLRNSGHYLATGLVDSVRIPALLLRGILMHWIVLLPYVVAAVWLTYWLAGDALVAAVTDGRPRGFWTPVGIAAALFVGWVLVSPVVQWLGHRRWFWQSEAGFATRNRYERSFGWLLLVVAVVALIQFLPTALSHYHHYSTEESCGGLAGIVKSVQGSWWLGALVSVAGAGLAALGSTTRSKLRRAVAMVGLALIGPLLFLWLYLSLGRWCMFNRGPQLPDWLRPDLPAALRIGVPDAMVDSGWWFFTLVVVLVFLYTWLAVDVNATSMHSFYRDRLSEAYMLQVDAKGDVLPKDHLELSRLGRTGRAPYHLVNAALNLQTDKDPDLRQRQAAFFFFSKHFIGSEKTGYCSTEDMEKAHARLDLGTAMAISGAAAAPNMGTSTVKLLVFLMALFNVRLGYWLPNPSKVDKGRFLRSGVGPIFLVKELFSLIDERSTFVNLSDGGHIENLGIYELLRRRCSYIIACDAEADPKMAFGSLAKLIRYAKIDLGVEISIDLGDLRKDDEGLSRSHCALGEIRYPEPHAGVGYLLYIKSSITGAEAEPIREYRSRHSDFPHESTGDQFFDEAQFEAYRALGYQAAETLFGGPDDDISASLPALDAWFQGLETELRPRFPDEEAFVSLQQRLTEVERALREDPALSSYAYQIYPEIAPGSGKETDETGAEEHLKIFHFCNGQMQLMEDVIVGLHLDEARNQDHPLNRGWMNLFRRWAQAPDFRWAWGVSLGTYSVAFQQFCQHALKLRSSLSFKKEGAWTELTPLEQRRLQQWRLASRDGTFERGDLLWIVRMHVEGGSPDERRPGTVFPIGLCFLTAEQDADDKWRIALRYCRVGNYYRRMRLFDRLLPELRAKLEADYRSPQVAVRFPRSQRRRVRKYFHILERHGFPVPPEEISPEDGVSG